jgi:ABC-type nitrate/sulfonate/bicarbonate transport system, permease component
LIAARGINLKKKISGDIAVKVFAVLLPVIIVLIWQLAMDTGAFDENLLPSPASIFQSMLFMIGNGTFFDYVLTSCWRVGIGFLIGGGLGLVLGIPFGLNEKARGVTSVVLGILQPIPPIALIPVFILWLGIGEVSKIAIIAVGSFWSVLLNTEEGMRAAKPELIELSYALEKSKREVLTEIIFPSAIPSIITGIRLGFSRAWSCVVAAEMIAASSGLGYLIEFARNLSKPAMMFLGVAMIGIIGLLIDLCMYWLQKKLVYWH